MARISGVDLPNRKQVQISLTYIFGIGRTSAALRQLRFVTARSSGSPPCREDPGAGEAGVEQGAVAPLVIAGEPHTYTFILQKCSALGIRASALNLHA